MTGHWGGRWGMGVVPAIIYHWNAVPVIRHASVHFSFLLNMLCHFCHTCSLCRVELVVQFQARGLTQVLLCLFPGLLWMWHFLYSVGPHPVSSLHIYTFVMSRAFMADAASQAGDADSSRASGLTSCLRVRQCPPWCSIVGVTVTVHQFFCILHVSCILMMFRPVFAISLQLEFDCIKTSWKGCYVLQSAYIAATMICCRRTLLRSNAIIQNHQKTKKISDRK